ncbi:PucR family transcriptional regulator [Streptomyces sp. 4N509B]|uniref:PucR family transcriptional regulator n=1 Tax=Streptomyces sp. 4N509B TaxID=3457413 RepID=UPI003FD0975C
MRAEYTEYQELVDEVCALLEVPATLEDRAFALIAHGAHDRADDRLVDPVRTRSILHRRSTAEVREWFEGFGIARARQPVRIPPEPAAGVLVSRICVPVRHGGVVYGYIWLLDDGALALDDPRLVTTAALAERLGGLLAARAREDDHLSTLLRAALTGEGGGEEGPRTAAEVADALGRAARGPLAVVAVLPWGAERGVPAAVPGAISLCAMPTGGGTASGGTEGSGATAPALAALAHPHVARAVAVRLGTDGSGLGNGAGDDAGAGSVGVGVGAGVSAARQDPAELAAAWRQALGAARAARAEPRFGGVAAWDEIGPYRLLTALPTPPDGGCDPAVAPLLLPEHRVLRHTAEVFLDHAGRATEAAAALGVHRQTLYYRLSRVERLTGLALDRGEDRLLLHMALRIARLARP